MGKRSQILIKTVFSSLAALAASTSFALDVSGITSQLPDDSKLSAINSAIQANPQNLDNYYAYATTAAQMHDYQHAADMYEKMLAVSPNLPRVKLELAMAYMNMSRFDDAKKLVDDVLRQKIPANVRKNLEPIKTQLDKATQRHSFGGSFALGATYNSNANTAPDSGIVNLRFAGQELPFVLTKDGRKRSDAQAYTALTLTHQYRHPVPIAKGVQASWQSSATYYRNKYRELNELNIGVTSIRTGPVISLMDGRAQIGATAGYNHVTLHHSPYLKQYLGEITAGYMVDASTRLRITTTKEWRNYINSATIKGFDLRDGQAQQASVGITKQIGKHDSIDSEIRLRTESTRRSYYDLNQIEYIVSYNHQFEDGWSAGSNVSLRNTNYNRPDPAISSKKRKELEWEAGINVAKQLENNVILTAGYDYRDVNANITNYTYADHRITTGLGWRF